jgi:hypothetical protein
VFLSSFGKGNLTGAFTSLKVPYFDYKSEMYRRLFCNVS